jgi:hypothetical protein
MRSPIYIKTGDLAASSKTYILNRQTQSNPVQISKINSLSNKTYSQAIKISDFSSLRARKQNVLVVSTQKSSQKKIISLIK